MASRSNLAKGTYSVSVSDSRNVKNYNYNVGQQVVWTELINSIETENRITKLNGSPYWDGGAVSKNSIEANENGWMEFVVDRLSGDGYMVGLSQVNPGANYTSINYAYYYSSGSLYIYESGTNIGYFGGLNKGDVLKIERIEGEIIYYKNTSILRTKAIAPNQPLVVDLSIVRGKGPYVSTSFCIPLLISPNVSYPSCHDNTLLGSINLAVTGNPPFKYLWKDGDSSSVKKDLQEGVYEVTVTDSKNLSKINVFNLRSKLEWTNFVGTTVVNDALTRVTPPGNWITGAISKNGLEPGENGSIEWVIDKLNNDAYMVGLSYIDAGASYYDINYAFNYNSGHLNIYETAVNAGNFGPLSVGDVLKIERVGEEIRYLKNGVLLRTKVGNSKQPLIVDATIASGSIPPIAASFCIPLSISASIQSSKCNNPELNSINLKITGNEPFKIEWNDGGEGSVRSNLPQGLYTAKVTDKKGNTKTAFFDLGNKVEWTDLESASIDEFNRLVKTINSPAWDAGAASRNGLEAGEDGWIEFVMEELSSDVFMAGLSPYNINKDYRTINYCFYYSNGNMNIYQNGYGSAIGPISRGDVYKIERVGNQLRYLKNNVLLKSITIDVTQPLIVDASIYRGSLPYISTSFCTPLSVTASIKSPTCDSQSSGSIDLTVSGNPPFTYQWNDGIGGSKRTNLSPGIYSVNIKDSKGLAKNVSYELGTQITWVDLVGATTDESNKIVKTTNSTAWDAGAASLEHLTEGKDGWIEFVIDKVLSSSYFIGLSSRNRDVTHTSQKYSFYINNGAISIYEGANSLGKFGTVSLGDVFRIERIGNEIRYLKNRKVLRSKTVNNSEVLIVDLSIAYGTTPYISTSFCLPNRPNPAIATFRSKASGFWNDYNIWEISNGGIYMTCLPGEIPDINNPVYLEVGHTVTLSSNASCKDLHLNTTADVIRLNTGENTLDVYGKIRTYIGTVPGINSTSAGVPNWIKTGTNGRIRLKGSSDRIITEKDEFSDHENLKGWTLECDLAEGVIGTINSNFRAGNVIITSGNLEVKSKNFKVSK